MQNYWGLGHGTVKVSRVRVITVEIAVALKATVHEVALHLLQDVDRCRRNTGAG